MLLSMNFTILLSLVSIAIAIPHPLTLAQKDISQDISEFQVKSLPDAPELPKSWAGRLAVPGTKTGNSLFFWLFEAEDPVYDDNFIIWLNGGPGCSSLIGLSTGIGPISFVDNSTELTSNPSSWTKLGHVLFLDQPVGTGFSTASNPNPATTNERVTSDFYSWLTVFYERFPHLLSKKTHMMGESWAGVYLPYFASKVLENTNTLPMNLQSISIGDGTFGNGAAIFDVAVGSYMRSKNASLHISDDILDAFSEADHTCGFDSVLAEAAVYPPKGPIHIPESPQYASSQTKRQDADTPDPGVMADDCSIHPTRGEDVTSSIMNSSCYGPCATFDTAWDFLDARCAASNPLFDIYNIEHGCDNTNTQPLLADYFSRPDVQTALNIPPPTNNDNTTFMPCNTKIQQTLTEPTQLPSPPAYNILPDLLTNNNISVHIYQGEDDMLANHLGAELVLQNMTWNGMQGFQEKPHQLFGGGDCHHGGELRECCAAGIWAEERGLTYHLFKGAGHSVPADKPAEMWEYVRNVVVGIS